jgi:hypothetical protein
MSQPPREVIMSWENFVRKALEDLRFGSVEIVVQDGRVVQIERREKIRLDKVERTQ